VWVYLGKVELGFLLMVGLSVGIFAKGGMWEQSNYNRDRIILGHGLVWR